MLTVRKSSTNAFTWVITAHTGREERRFYSKVTTDSEEVSENVTFIQEAKPEFIELTTASSILIPAVLEDGYYIQVRANSNSSLISIDIEGEGLKLLNCFIEGDVYKPGSTIPLDPGLESQFMFSANIQIKSNSQVTQRTCRVTLTDNAGHSVYCDIIQEAAIPVITVTPSSVDVPAAGGSGSIMVSANDTWTVSVVESI